MESKNNMNFHPTQIGYITMNLEPISNWASMDDVMQMFDSNPEIDAFPVEHYNGIGIIEKSVIESNSKSFWKSITGQDISKYISTKVMATNSREYTKKLFKKIVVEKKENVHFLTVYHDGQYQGIVKYNDIINHISDLQEWEIEQARKVQQFLLDKNEIKDDRIKIKTNLRMAHELGGDFCSVLKLSEDVILVAGFDVSGKNISASLLTIMINSFFTLVKMGTIGDLSHPAKILENFNKFVHEQTTIEQYVACAIMFIYKKTNKVYLYNFGYTSPCIISVSEDKKPKASFLNPNFPPIGIQDDLDVSENPYIFDMTKVKSVFMFSDGLSDAIDQYGERFGDERIKEFIANNFKKMGTDFIEEMNKKIDSFIRSTPQADDITSIIVNFL